MVTVVAFGSTGLRVLTGALMHCSIFSLVTAGLVTVLIAAGVVLRVLVLRGAFGAVAVDLDAVDLRGIKRGAFVTPKL